MIYEMKDMSPSATAQISTEQRIGVGQCDGKTTRRGETQTQGGMTKLHINNKGGRNIDHEAGREMNIESVIETKHKSTYGVFQDGIFVVSHCRICYTNSKLSF